MKSGEAEARLILEKFGVLFDDDYNDDNSRSSMPDFKYLNEDRYLEITHTDHNNNIAKGSNKFDELPFEEQNKRIEQAAAAMERIRAFKYPDVEEGQRSFEQDAKIIKETFGFNVKSFTEQTSEFSCDMPTLYFSTDNILKKLNSKAKKHSSGNTDLFMFVAGAEYKLMQQLINDGNKNGCYINFMNAILASPFPAIYICAWDFERQAYETETPRLTKFEKKRDEEGKKIMIRTLVR